MLQGFLIIGRKKLGWETSSIKDVDQASVARVKEKTGCEIRKGRNGHVIVVPQLKLDEQFETEYGPMTLEEYWDSSHEHVRAQAHWRGSTSWNAFLDRNEGVPIAYDNGSHILYTLSSEAWFGWIKNLIQKKRVADNSNSPQFLSDILAMMAKSGLSSEYIGELLQELKRKPEITAQTIPQLRKLYNKKLATRKRSLANKNASTPEDILSKKPPEEIKCFNDLETCYVFVKAYDNVYDRLTGQLISLLAMARSHSSQLLNLELEAIPKTFIDSLNSIKVDDITYWPVPESGLVYYKGKTLINTWKPSPLTLVAGDPFLWCSLAEWLIHNETERDHLFDWMAFVLQHPEQKINHHPLIGGVPRTGKDTLFLPLRYGLGLHNIVEIPAETLLEPYQDYLLSKKLIFIQEIENFEKRSVENKLKPMLASPPEELNVRLFHKGFISQPNIQVFVFFSNHRNAMKISEGDGRIFAVWCAPEKPKNDVYYKRLYQWLHEQDGLEIVVDWLLKRDVSHFNPSAPAPVTEFKRSIMELGKSDLEMRIRELIDNSIGPFHKDAVYARDVQDHFESKEIGPVPSIKSITNTLAEMGAIKRTFQTGPKHKRLKHHVWIIRNQEEWKNATPASMIEMLRLKAKN